MMHAQIDEPTHRVVWEVVDQETVRVKFAEVETSDGIPSPIEAETSQTTAVTIPDLDAAVRALVELGARDGVKLVAFGVRVDERTPIDQCRSLRLCISDWWRFRQWLPTVMSDLERLYYQRLDMRKAHAVVYRMRLFAATVAAEMPPMNYTVLCLE